MASNHCEALLSSHYSTAVRIGSQLIGYSFAEDVGNFDKDEANDVFELILDLREKQTLFTPLIHKELFLSRLKENLSKATYNKDWKKNGKPAIIPYGRDTDDASADDGDAAD